MEWTNTFPNPFHRKSIVARVNALLRRSGLTAGNDEKFVEAGGIKLDKTAHLVTVDGRPIELSIKEFELLDYLWRIRELHYPVKRY